MNVITHLEAYRFLVPSRTKRMQYLVDMEENGGVGVCNCPHYQYRITPEIKRVGIDSIGSRARCAHINEVTAWLVRRAIRNETKTKAT